MKLLTTEQLRASLLWLRQWFQGPDVPDPVEDIEICAVGILLTAECREHGYAGIEDAYKHLITKETT